MHGLHAEIKFYLGQCGGKVLFGTEWGRFSFVWDSVGEIQFYLGQCEGD